MTDRPEIRWYTAREVQSICKCSRGYIYRLMRDKNFPKPIHLSQRCRRWDAAAVDAWIEAQLKQGAH